MGKVWIEVSLISARGLRRSSLWKLQWFAVGWIDPKNKYCTRIDETGNSNPIWKMKFATLIDGSAGSGLPGLALHVEVYSREPVFLRESLLGTASVPLKEFLSKHSRKGDRKGKSAIEEVGSYQLRKGNSGKPLGFIDVSVHISEEGDAPNHHYSDQGGMVFDHENNQMTFKEDGSAQPQLHITRRARQNRRPGESPLAHNHNISINETKYPGRPTDQPPRGTGYHQAQTMHPQAEMDYPPAQTLQSQVETGYHPARTMQPHVETGYHPARTRQPHVETGYHPPRTTQTNVETGHHPARTMHPAERPGYPTARTPPPPPPPSHVGFIPTVMPRMENVHGSYTNMPPSTSRGPGFGAGLGAGALAAGAVIFGDDFLSGFDYVRDGSRDPNLTVSVDHPF